MSKTAVSNHENAVTGYRVIACYNGRERLWTVERFNLRQIKMETGQQVRKHVRNLLETAED